MAKVLIIDDSPTLVRVLKEALETQGYIVLDAGDGMAGLELAKVQMPDLVVLDLMLPKLDGNKVAKLLKLDQKYKGIKIMMLTAKAGESDRKLGLESGADEYVTKDIGINKIVEKVNDLLKSKET